MNFKRFHESKNLAPPISEWVDGYVNGNDGSISPASTINKEKISGYISIEPGKAYTFSREGSFPQGSDTAWRGIGWYDNNKNFISRAAYSSTNALSVNAPSNAVYCRLSFRTYGETTETMFNHGSTALPYEPYSSEVWHGIPHYIHNTSADTLTTLPAVLYANDITATVGLKGQTVQNGTPTPENPVIPQGTGERTGNLYFKKLAGANISDVGEVTTLTGFDLYIAKVEQGARYSGTGYIYSFFENEPTIGSISFDSSRVLESFHNIVSPINGFVAVRHTNTVQNAMCNTGSEVLPYEPFGVKIPISSANTTTPVYLGEVQTTRKIKKLVLTGEEQGWSRYRTGAALAISSMKNNMRGTGRCSHFTPTFSPSAETKDAVCFGASNNLLYILFSDSTASALNITNLDSIKQWLRDEYAAGTPVTVWYVLEAEETAVVNEPLMRIGDYADEVSNVSIPAIAGGDTLSVDTTVQPSEVTVDYKGWHPVADVHERENGQWD